MSAIAHCRALLLLVTYLCCDGVRGDDVNLFSCTTIDNKNCTHLINSTEHFQLPPNVELLTKSVFDGYPDLLDVTGTPGELKSLEPGAFEGLPNLLRIFLGGNKLKIIPDGVFSDLPIYYLYLAGNEIHTISNNSFANMNKLEEIYLDKNSLSKFDRNWFQTKSAISFLKTLSVHHNKIKSLEAGSFHNCPQLNSIDFSFNEIEYISDDLFNDPLNIVKFDLSFNKLTTLSPNILANVNKVNNFYISFNFLRNLNSSLLDNVKIKEISMHPNEWLCPCMKEVEKQLTDKSVKIITTENFLKGQDFIFKTQFRTEPPTLSVCSETWKECPEELTEEQADTNFHKILEKAYGKINIKCAEQCPGNKLCKSNFCWSPIVNGYFHEYDSKYFVWTFSI
ncbi:phospholipase A2 inhibitor [Aethina tumida]|uniref:phospholipase A2 inhibitor n=1 Tax=Aethina tumida TaxID=116153 RepID=UPI002148279B|nr:phospholipase A2 inhibitor [Aethina tumida]